MITTTPNTILIRRTVHLVGPEIGRPVSACSGSFFITLESPHRPHPHRSPDARQIREFFSQSENRESHKPTKWRLCQPLLFFPDRVHVKRKDASSALDRGPYQSLCQHRRVWSDCMRLLLQNLATIAVQTSPSSESQYIVASADKGPVLSAMFVYAGVVVFVVGGVVCLRGADCKPMR